MKTVLLGEVKSQLQLDRVGEVLGGFTMFSAAIIILVIIACAIIMPLCVVMIDSRVNKINRRHASEVDEARRRHEALMAELRVQTAQLRAMVDALRR